MTARSGARRDRDGGAAYAMGEQGVDEFDFYTLDRADLTYAVCRRLGLRPTAGGASQPTSAAHRGYDGRQPTTVKRKETC